MSVLTTLAVAIVYDCNRFSLWAERKQTLAGCRTEADCTCVKNLFFFFFAVITMDELFFPSFKKEKPFYYQLQSHYIQELFYQFVVNRRKKIPPAAS